MCEALEVSDGPTALRFPKGDVGEDIPALERRDGIDVLAVPADGLSDDVLAGGDEINLTEMKDEDLLRMMALDLKSVMAG